MALRKLLPLVVLVATVACGGDDSPTGPSSSQIQPVNQTQTGTVSAFGAVRHPLTIQRAGQLTLRLTWSDPMVDLDLYLSAVACTELYPMSACTVLAASDAATGTQESILRTVAAGETYQIWIDNLHLTRPQNYTLTLTIQ